MSARPSGHSGTVAFRLHQAKVSPATPPSPASKRLSVSNCRITRQRFAPRQSRNPISFWRAAPRASSKLARLAQAMSSTMPLATSTMPEPASASAVPCPVKFAGKTRTLSFGSISG